MFIEFKAAVSKNGTITIGPIAPADYETVRHQILSIAIGTAGEKPIGEAGCLTPEQIEELAQRLAELLIREVA